MSLDDLDYFDYPTDYGLGVDKSRDPYYTEEIPLDLDKSLYNPDRDWNETQYFYPHPTRDDNFDVLFLSVDDDSDLIYENYGSSYYDQGAYVRSFEDSVEYGSYVDPIKEEQAVLLQDQLDYADWYEANEMRILSKTSFKKLAHINRGDWVAVVRPNRYLNMSHSPSSRVGVVQQNLNNGWLIIKNLFSEEIAVFAGHTEEDCDVVKIEFEKFLSPEQKSANTLDPLESLVRILKMKATDLLEEGIERPPDTNKYYYLLEHHPYE